MDKFQLYSEISIFSCAYIEYILLIYYHHNNRISATICYHRDHSAKAGGIKKLESGTETDKLFTALQGVILQRANNKETIYYFILGSACQYLQNYMKQRLWHGDGVCLSQQKAPTEQEVCMPASLSTHGFYNQRGTSWGIKVMLTWCDTLHSGFPRWVIGEQKLNAFDLKEGSSEPGFVRGNKSMYFLSIPRISLKVFSISPPEEEQNLSNVICWCAPSFSSFQTFTVSRSPRIQFPNISTIYVHSNACLQQIITQVVFLFSWLYIKPGVRLSA